MVSVNTAQLFLIGATYLVAIWIGWAGQLLRENGLAQTRRELRQAYREYDELLTLLHVTPVVEQPTGGAPRLPVRVEHRPSLTVVRGDAS